ncbi:MAG TPA: transposase [Blastocatellia bacterium]|nr:transposase [Blastocatellia bacterium]
MAIEPKTGTRPARVTGRRAKLGYARCLKELAARYPKAEKTRIVQDHLNTHRISAFYEAFSAEGAIALAQRFGFDYTPKRASWLNRIEVEFSALPQQCLNRRIASTDQLQKEASAIVKEREEKAVKIDGQFTIESARNKLNRHCQPVNADNAQDKRTWFPLY